MHFLQERPGLWVFDGEFMRRFISFELKPCLIIYSDSIWNMSDLLKYGCGSALCFYLMYLQVIVAGRAVVRVRWRCWMRMRSRPLQCLLKNPELVLNTCCGHSRVRITSVVIYGRKRALDWYSCFFVHGFKSTLIQKPLLSYSSPFPSNPLSLIRLLWKNVFSLSQGSVEMLKPFWKDECTFAVFSRPV